MSYRVLIVREPHKQPLLPSQIMELVDAADLESLSNSLKTMSNRFAKMEKRRKEEEEVRKKKIWKAYQEKQGK